MKRAYRLVMIVVGAAGVACSWGAVTVGCSSSGTAVQADAGGDSTTDSPADVGSDAALDGDAGGGSDAALDGDAGGDGQAGGDAQTDSAVAMFDGSPLDFPALVATAECNNIAKCCGTSGDAASFNWTLCYGSEFTGGFHGSSVGVNLFDAGHVVFNAAQAQTCLDVFASVDCLANEITTTEDKQLYQSCFGAFVGTLAAGSPCQGTIECAPGNFCSPFDGGVGDSGAIGLCQALLGAGGACGILGSNETTAQTVCSYRGSGENGLFCQGIDAGAPHAGAPTLTQASTWTCQPQEPNGTTCYAGVDCTSDICDPGVQGNVYQCANATEYIAPSSCPSLYVDAGSGG